MEIVTSMAQTPDGGFLLSAGYGPLPRPMALTKVNSNGGIQWSKVFNVGQNIWEGEVYVTPEGDFLLAGAKEYGGDREVVRIKLNPQGTVLSSWRYFGSEDLQMSPASMTQDGGMIIAGQMRIQFTSSNPFCLKLDNAGYVDWCKLYLKENTESVTAVRQTLDGGYILVGGEDQYQFSTDAHIYAIRTNQSGELMWTREYPTSVGLEAQKVEIEPTGEFLVSGDVYNNPPNSRYLYRIDANGNGGCNQAVPQFLDSTIHVSRLTLDLDVYASDLVQTIPAASFNGSFCSGNPNTLICGFEPSDLSVSATQSNVTCNGDGDGTASAEAFNGIEPYSYEWNTEPVQTGPDISDLSPGQYTCTVTDSTGTQISSIVVVEEPEEFSAELTGLGATELCLGDSTSFWVGNNPGWVYQWYRNDSIAVNGLDNGYTAYVDGRYHVAVTDTATDCTIESDDINVFMLELDVGIFEYPEQNLLQSSVLASSYQWYLNGEPISGATSSSHTATVSGNYQVAIIDDNGCEAVSYILEYTLQVGIEELVRKYGIAVTPNPTQDSFFVLGEQLKELEIKNASGKLIQTINGGLRNQVEVNGLSSGLYLIRAQMADGSVENAKVVVQ